MNGHTQRVLDEISAERYRQRQEFSDDHDSRHHPCTWVAIACRHLGLGTQDGGLTNRTIYRRQLIRCAAVCAAAVEALDRSMPPAQPEDSALRRLEAMAQRMADDYSEPILILPANRKRTDVAGSITIEHHACCVPLSQSTAEERSQTIKEVKPS